MRRKTVIRRMANYLPMSIEFSNALTVDDAVNAGNKAVIAGQFVEIDEGSELEHIEGDPKDGDKKDTGATDSPLDRVRRICADAIAIKDKPVAQLRLDDARFDAKDLTGDVKAEAEKLIADAGATIDGKLV